jgi:pyruvate/2-oxoglutarate/acetoin dehydrogenase E1 component
MGAPMTTTSTRTPAPQEASRMPTRQLTYVKAYNEGLAQVMREDDDVFVIGEDVAGYGGVFHMYDGLLTEFGPRRMIDTPISEAAIVGLGVGAASRGLRPVVDIMFMDFLAVCLDQVVNQAAKMKFMFGGSVRVPLTITTAYGAGVSAAAQHSQSLETWLAHTPGLKVVMPTTAYDAKGLIVASIRDDNPVVFMQHKMLFGLKGNVPEELYEVRLGEAAVRRPGTDVTIVALGRMVHEAITAATQLDAEGVSCEVIDPRTVQPLDSETIVESVRRTNRVLVVHEAVRFGGIGAEIASQIQEDAFDYLDAPVGRLGAPFTPVPFSPALEANYLPNATKIAEAARQLVKRG